MQDLYIVDDKKEIVILIHGLLRTKYSMFYLERYLKHHGYTTYLYTYPSTKYTLFELSNHLSYFLDEFTKLHKGKKIHFVTHSMGGIICREALRNFSDSSSFGSFIMLAPPNQGAPIAYNLLKRFPFLSKLLKPLPQLSNDPHSLIYQVYIPTNINIGVIAGKYDRKTPPEVTHIMGEKDHIVIGAGHTFIMNSLPARQAILNFIKNCKF